MPKAITEPVDILSPTAPAMITIPQALHVFQVSRATMNRWIASGKIDAVKIGFGTRITTPSVRRHLASLPAADFRSVA